MPMASTTLASSSLAALALILEKGVPDEAGRVLELAPAPKVSYKWCATRLAAPCGWREGQGLVSGVQAGAAGDVCRRLAHR
jgi:hypothetical protein